MAFFYCDRRNCTGLAVVSSLIIGIIAAFLKINAAITVTPAFYWVVLGVAVGFLGILLTTGRGGGLIALPLGILGSVLLSLILLAASFAATSIIGGIFFGALLFFFFLTITAALCYIRSAHDC